MAAASSSSLGSVLMNWTMRKMKNASVARNLGTISGQIVLIQSSLENTMYCGTTVTWYGSMIEPSMTANQSFFSGKSSRANAYAASEQATRFATTVKPVRTAEFHR